MSKNNTGKVLAFLAGAGAAAAAIAYLVRYKTFSNELEKDFRAFEDEELEEDDKSAGDLDNPSHRNYVSLSSSKDELKAAAKDMKDSAEAAASAAKDVLKDTAAVLKDTAHEAVSAAVDTAHLAASAVKETIDGTKEKLDSVEKMAEEAAGEIADAADAVSHQIDNSVSKNSGETTTVEEITE